MTIYISTSAHFLNSHRRSNMHRSHQTVWMQCLSLQPTMHHEIQLHQNRALTSQEKTKVPQTTQKPESPAQRFVPTTFRTRKDRICKASTATARTIFFTHLPQQHPPPQRVSN